MSLQTVYKPEGYLSETAANRQSMRSAAALREAFEQGKILEGRATVCDAAHNLTVDLGCMRGIIPRTECALGIEENSTRDIAILSRVNKPVVFVITGFEERAGETVAILSRRRVQQACMEQFVNLLRPGDVIDCRITHMEQFGAFADIGCGIASLMPIDRISVSRISHPSDRFRNGDKIRAVVCGIDRETGRITLSQRELFGTWEENAARFTAGETVAGIIRSVEPYGVFVELTPNLAGLAEPREGVRAGQHASVYIKNLIPEKMKVKLIIVDAFDADYCAVLPPYTCRADHISRFRYSPEECEKVMETVFDE